VVCHGYRAYSAAVVVQPSQVDGEPQVPARDSEKYEVETCTVERWRGYISSSFIALLDDATPVAQSPEFRCRGRAKLPDAGPARRAYDGLRAELHRLGWEDTDERPETWYASRFTRLIAVPVDEASENAVALETPAPHIVETIVAVEPERRRLREAPPAPPAPPAPQRAEPAVEPEPRHLEETPVLPPAAQKSAEVPQRSRIVTIVCLLGIAGAMSIGAYLGLSQRGGHTTRYVTTPASVTKPPQVTAIPAPQPTAANVRLNISANEHASWLEVRRGSATGRVLFTGELAPGQPLHLRGKRLWARFGAARNLTITANGRPVALGGTIEHVFTAAKR
jgi:Domain of unknown function (DUF4115)